MQADSGTTSRPRRRDADWPARAAMATPLAVALFGLSLAWAVLTHRALYADGAYMFLRVLEQGGTVDVWVNRAFAHRLFQAPMVLAMKLGLRNLDALLFLFNLGCFLPWLCSLWFCFQLSRRWFWVVLLSVALGYGNAGFMAVGEHNLSHAFFWPVAFALLFCRPLTPFAAMVLVTCATVLIRSYEATLFLGPALAGLAIWRLWRHREAGWRRWVLLAAVGLLLAAGWVGLRGVMAPEAKRNFGDFQSGVWDLLMHPSGPVIWSAAAALLLVLLYLRPRLLDRLPPWLLAAALGIACLAWALWPMLQATSVHPDLQHRFRVLNMAVPLGLLAALLLAQRRPQRFATARPVLATVAAALLALQSVWQLAATTQWWGYLGVFRGVLESNQGVVIFEDTPLATRHLGAQSTQFDWVWPLPSLSIVLAPGGQVRTLIVGRNLKGRPFSPANPAALPDLTAYGIDYSLYRQALAGAAPR